ncbi:anti-Muellerian hormone type-2 receptor isoform X2 [Electrophorus electricus]|uniref:anti-Muellerian hormone type-2 receptor isoform X2 n=1 Tax=Electrophorus electricus TaxID=8005 RepID=UPI0015D00983|nr:anti-Muellerian hormone type-2 receptor isoform X2 [Electrophorus electricus]
MQLSLIVFVASIDWLSTCIPAPPVAPERKCAFLASPRNTETARSAGNVSGGVQHCARTNCCMGFFQLEHGQARPDLLGCSAVGTSCPESSCHASKPTQNYVRCLCSSDYCNLNITWNDQAKQSQPSHASDLLSAICFITFAGALITVLSLITSVKWKFLKDCKSVRPPHTCDIQKEADIDLANIELQKVVAYGHFACVWQGFFQGSLVALKVFPATLRQAFIKEKDVYLLHSMTHSGIAQFLGAGRMGKEFVLVLELATQGSLNKFLSTNVCNWASTLKLVQTLAQGLAYLHSDFNKNGVYKPVIAHCDLSSSNVLVKADGSCALCDFGCSMVLQCSRTHRALQGHSDRTEVFPTPTGGIQMGTLHYMSPEILEGCVNLSSGRCLLQGDVYSLGLLLWELLVCCSDLRTDSIVPVHVLPYEAELGPSPSLEDLLSLVSEQRVRPTIPLYWDTHCQGFSVQELLEDCWDHDPDARLTAQCTADRLASLPAELVLGKATFDA